MFAEERRRGALHTVEIEILRHELADYWNVLQPIFEWTAGQRRRDGYLFLRDEVFPRRKSMLGIADRIGAINESQLNTGKNKVEAAANVMFRRLFSFFGYHEVKDAKKVYDCSQDLKFLP